MHQQRLLDVPHAMPIWDLRGICVLFLEDALAANTLLCVWLP